MPEENAGDKQFDATPHKLREAHKKGQVFKSRDLTQLVTFIVGFFIIFYSAGFIWENCSRLFNGLWNQIPHRSLSTIGYGFIFYNTFYCLAIIMLPLLLALLITAVAVEFFQVGPIFTTETMKFSLEKLNPFEGFKKIIFNVRSLFELLKSAFKVGVLGYIAYITFNKHMEEVLSLIEVNNKLSSIYVLGDLFYDFTVRSMIFLLVVTILDYLFQRWKYLSDQKMTFKELKDEFKQTEGDPLIKAIRRQKQQQVAYGQMMVQVQEADFVVTNPDHIAMALKYEPEMDSAPRILAKGTELIALQIIEIAEQFGIPVIENVPLARALFRLVRVNQIIPPELYRAVAEILIFIYQLRGKGQFR
ncbi:MAG: EscU/YscU/HrcU family type III secretion system export apparatus switch protein [Candidatus Melainabacteria bacterium]|nr:EscU/YscU/HrcU family type III secretion system export apparatus switch protein [Candidatus Melainabacteria bacterium]